MKVVIDFTGYYIKNKFMIKEFCRSDVLLRKVRTEKIIITKHPTSSECPSKREYDNYYNKYGIKKFVGHASLESLREYISSVFKQKLIQNSIYVRDPKKIQLLNEFMGRKFDGSVKCLTDFGFNTQEIVTTTCKYHDRMYSYCAQDNALVMANWLMEKNSSAVQTSKYIDHLILDFAGHNNKSQQFVIKELSLYGLSGTGDVVYQKSYVFKSYGHYDKLQPEEKNNFDNFYNTHGIQWLSGTQILGRFKSNFNKLLINSGVKFIYVKDSEKKNILTTIIGDAINVICLDRFNYQEVIDKPSNCGQHSHEDSGRNKCVDDSAQSMLEWVLKNEFYKHQGRKCDEVNNPIASKQQFSQESDNYCWDNDSEQSPDSFKLENIQNFGFEPERLKAF